MVLIFDGLLSFFRWIWAEVGGAGGSVWRWRVETSSIIVVVSSSNRPVLRFRRSEFEIGFYIEIGILPEPSEQIIIFKINSRDSRNSDDQ